MRFDDLLSIIHGKMSVVNSNYEGIWKWSITNHNSLQSQYLISIKDESLVKASQKDRSGKIFKINKLEHSVFFIGLANTYVNSNLFNEGIQLFEEMRKRGSNESTMFNDYGRSLLVKMIARKNFSKDDLDLARKFISEAYGFDKKVSSNPYEYPAYKNLCYLRTIEACFYYSQTDLFIAFVLAWMSIEMTITRIWNKFLSLKSVNGKPLEDLKISSIIKILGDSVIDDKLKMAKKDLKEFKNEVGNLNNLRRVRKQLLHGYTDNPSTEQTEQCIETALKLHELFQSIDQDFKS